MREKRTVDLEDVLAIATMKVNGEISQAEADEMLESCAAYWDDVQARIAARPVVADDPDLDAAAAEAIALAQDRL